MAARRRLLIVGVSTRAAAESAARAGFEVTAIDAFADCDQDSRVRAISVVRDNGERFTASAVARLARSVDGDAVAYLSNFENHRNAVRMLSMGRTLWGNPPDVLRRVRDPKQLAEALGRRGFEFAAVCAGDTSDPGTRDWLLKPLRSGGGVGVRRWRPGSRVPRGTYLQELVEGTDGSISFVAAAGAIVPLAVCRQLIGKSAFGAGGYRYCGSILETWDTKVIERATALAHAVTEEFGLVGVNGIDFVVRDDVPVAIEVNPRWSASMELVERAHGFSVFGAHASACTMGELPAERLLTRRPTGAIGKAIVFARRDVTIGDTGSWLEDENVRDVPHPDERIRAGAPICTVFASADDADACYAGLVRRAEAVCAQLSEWQRNIA